MRLMTMAAILGLSVAPGLAMAQMAPGAPPPDAPPPGAMPPGGPMMDGHGGHKHDAAWRDMRHDAMADMLTDFYAANTTHDGHLTLAQAKSADFRPVVDHFDEIDTKKRGYVTFYDIQAWHMDDMAKHLMDQADALRAKD